MDLNNIEDRIEHIRLHINTERMNFFGSILEDKVIIPKKLKIETNPELINKSCQKLVDLEYRNKIVKKRTLIGNKNKNTSSEHTTNENDSNANTTIENNTIKNTTIENTIENTNIQNNTIQNNTIENTTIENTTIENTNENKVDTKPLCNILYNRPWNKLEKMVKLNRFKYYINNQSEWSSKEKTNAYKTIEKVVEFNYLNKASDVDYDKNIGEITNIKKLNISINEKGERQFSIIFT